MFSIVIPIYNVEKYLKKCLESVLEQSIDDYELILVDDGSPDGCGKLCDQFAHKYDCIKVVHKQNGGLSSARNAGLDIAVGSYVIFLDGDDFWDDKDALKNIKNNIEETDADLLVFPVKRFYEEENRYTYTLNVETDRNQIVSRDVNNAIKYMLENNIYRASACNKVVRKSIIELHQLRFKVGYLSEDMDWCGDLLLYCRKFDFYENPFYCYLQQRAGSITTGKTEKLVADKLYMIEKGYEQAKKLTKGEKTLLASYYAYEYSVALGVSAGVKSKKILSQLKNLSSILDFDINNKVKKVKKLRSVLGYRIMRIALCVFVRIKK